MGRATALRLASLGAKVAVLDVKGFEDTAKLIQDKHNNTHVFSAHCDVTNLDNVKAAIEASHKALGKINTLVNCAGVFTPSSIIGDGAGFVAHAQRLFDVNVMGTLRTTQVCAEIMSKNDLDEYNERGVIIHTASIAGYECNPNFVAYGSSKSAVFGMTLPMARELGPTAIRVNTIAPGLFNTDMIGAFDATLFPIPFPKRKGEPEEFAYLVESIIANPMMNGAVIRLDAALRA